jgi:putative copper resistance protein D
MNLLTTTFKFLNLIGGFAVVGALLSMAFLVLNKDGYLTTSGEKVRRLLKISSLIWVVGAFGTIIFTLAQILGTTISDALDCNQKNRITHNFIGADNCRVDCASL